MTNTRTRGGPHLGALAITTLGLTVLGVVVGAALSGGSTGQTPFVGIDDLTRRFTTDALAVRISSFFTFAAAVPLGILAAALATRLRRIGVRVPGPSIGFYGGVTAAILLALSALLTWTGTVPDVAASPALLRALAVLAFLTGGTGYAVGVGLLVAGAAVPGFVLRLVPRWFAITGLVIAAVAELSSLSLLVDPLQYLIPVARFGGGLWLIVAGFLLTRRPVRDEGTAA